MCAVRRSKISSSEKNISHWTLVPQFVQFLTVICLGRRQDSRCLFFHLFLEFPKKDSKGVKKGTTPISNLAATKSNDGVYLQWNKSAMGAFFSLSKDRTKIFFSDEEIHNRFTAHMIFILSICYICHNRSRFIISYALVRSMNACEGFFISCDTLTLVTEISPFFVNIIMTTSFIFWATCGPNSGATWRCNIELFRGLK